MRLGKKKAMMTFFAITLVLGLGFLGVEIYEFYHIMYMKELRFKQVHFLSVLLTTLGTHGAHVTFGFFWGLFIIIQVEKRGLNATNS